MQLLTGSMTNPAGVRESASKSYPRRVSKDTFNSVERDYIVQIYLTSVVVKYSLINLLIYLSLTLVKTTTVIVFKQRDHVYIRYLPSVSTLTHTHNSKTSSVAVAQRSTKLYLYTEVITTKEMYWTLPFTPRLSIGCPCCQFHQCWCINPFRLCVECLTFASS